MLCRTVSPLMVGSEEFRSWHLLLFEVLKCEQVEGRCGERGVLLLEILLRERREREQARKRVEKTTASPEDGVRAAALTGALITCTSHVYASSAL